MSHPNIATIERVKLQAERVFIDWTRLTNFMLDPLYTTMTKQERELLVAQEVAMASYYSILKKRLELYGFYQN